MKATVGTFRKVTSSLLTWRCRSWELLAVVSLSVMPSQLILPQTDSDQGVETSEMIQRNGKRPQLKVKSQSESQIYDFHVIFSFWGEIESVWTFVSIWSFSAPTLRLEISRWPPVKNHGRETPDKHTSFEWVTASSSHHLKMASFTEETNNCMSFYIGNIWTHIMKAEDVVCHQHICSAWATDRKIVLLPDG